MPNQILYPVLIRFAKTDLMRFVGHLDWLNIQQTMFLRAGIPVGTGDGPTHRLRMKTSPPTPVGVESFAEFTYLLLSSAIYPDEIQRRLAEHCPEGIKIISVRDAGYLLRKNPFVTIEAASYMINPGNDISETTYADILAELETIKSGKPPNNIDYEELKPFWGRILEISNDGASISLIVDQREAFTFHGAKCASYLMSKLRLPHYPIFTKLDYYRLKPSKRRLFR